MVTLQALHIAKQFDGRDVLTDASLVVHRGERVALIGPNGAGKSTLLGILIGDIPADAGDVQLAPGVRTGHVAQFNAPDGNTTVFAYTAEVFAELRATERRMRALEEEMGRPEVYGDAVRFAALTARYDELRRTFEEAGGYAADARIRRVLAGLGFPQEVHGRPVRELSGGQRTRLALARLLASEPDLLVLDEPNNYLDIEALTWLEEYLMAYPGSVLVVSHDRYFLDRVAQVVYELEGGVTTRYPGNYSDFLEHKASRLEAQAEACAAQQREIQRIQTFVERNIARASTARRAQSRRKWLEKLVPLERPDTRPPRMAVSFTARTASGRDVLEVRGLKTGYPQHPCPGTLSLTVLRGQRIAIVGPNGAGKTTLLRTLCGEIPPLAGEIRWGANVHIGYCDQEQRDLDESKTVLDSVWDDHPELDQTTIRTALGRFLFRGEEVHKPVGALSGGERSRLALCRLMLRKSNVLVMDEPTNHLDILAKEVLEDALQDFDGTLLMVSHDRYFIDALATHVLEVNEAGFTLYIGNYTEYLERRGTRSRDQFAQPAGAGAGRAGPGTKAPPGVAPADGVSGHAGQGPASERAAGEGRTTGESRTTGEGRAAPGRRVRSADVRKLREKVASLETRIAALEAKQAEVGEKFADVSVFQDPARVRALQAELDALAAEQAALLADWETALQELEALEAMAAPKPNTRP